MPKTKNPTLAEGFYPFAEAPSITFVVVGIPTSLAQEIKEDPDFAETGWNAEVLRDALRKGFSRIRAERRYAKKHGKKS